MIRNCGREPQWMQRKASAVARPLCAAPRPPRPLRLTSFSHRAIQPWLRVLSPTFLVLAGLAPAQEDGDAEEDAAPRIFLDKSPRIVAFQLGRLSNAQLVKVERKADDPKYRPVHEAILARPGLDRKYREEALAALAAINKTGLVPEILAAAARLDEAELDEGIEYGGVFHDIVHVLGMQPREPLAAERARLEVLASGAKKPVTRRLAYAGIVQADGGVDRAWEMAEKAENGLIDLLGAVPMLHDAFLRAVFRSRALCLLDAGDSETRRAAIEALGEIRSETPSEEEAVFTALAALVRKGVERDPAVRALRRIPPQKWPANWPAGSLDDLAAAVIDSIRAKTAEERTSAEALEAMELGRAIASRLPPERGSRLRKEIAALGVRVVLIKTLPHQMLFDQRFFAVDAAKPVEIVFENPDIMPHNFVIVLPGALEEVGRQADQMQLTPDPSALQFVPPGGKVLRATRLIAPGERLKLSFIAPKEPGNYPFVCTFPSHWRRMYGTMVVVPDVEAWLASGTEPPDPLGNTRKLVKEWQPEDFAADIGAAPRGKSFERGKKLLEEASCISCHPFRGQGGAVGPELSDAFQRWKQNRAELLLQILDPARKVEEKYRTHVVQTRDGFIHVGVIVAEDEKAISIVTNPQSPIPQAVPKGRIARRSLGEGSLMPIGLLNNFTKEEVLEILTYLESGGNPKSEVYKGSHAGH